jgi:hypothetical protein
MDKAAHVFEKFALSHEKMRQALIRRASKTRNIKDHMNWTQKLYKKQLRSDKHVPHFSKPVPDTVAREMDRPHSRWNYSAVKDLEESRRKLNRTHRRILKNVI